MQRTEIIKRLSRLTDRERAVLGHFCQGLEYWKIGNEIGLSAGTIKSHMYHIFNKLELAELGRGERRTTLLEQYCPVLKAGDLDLPPEEPTHLVPLPLGAREEIDALQYEIIEYKTEDLIPLPSESRKPLRLGRLFGCSILVLVLLATLGGLFMWGPGLADRYFNPIPVETRIAQGIQGTLDAQSELETSVAALYTASAPSPDETIILPSLTPSTLPTSTILPSPIPSRIPSATLSPTPSIRFPFSDDFDNGADPAWTTLNGTWIIADGRYSIVFSNENQYLWNWSILENIGTANYRVSVHYELKYPGAASQGQVALAVRLVPSQTKYLALLVGLFNDDGWAFIGIEYSDNELVIGDIEDMPSQGTIEIQANDNEFIALLNGREIQRLVLPGYTAGGVGLGIVCKGQTACPSFDDFSIEPLD